MAQAKDRAECRLTHRPEGKNQWKEGERHHERGSAAGEANADSRVHARAAVRVSHFDLAVVQNLNSAGDERGREQTGTDLESAERSKRATDTLACGGVCWRSTHIVDDGQEKVTTGEGADSAKKRATHQ